MLGRLPSITETEDSLVLSWSLDHDGELPGWMSEYTRDALATAGWITPGSSKLNDDGLENARKWRQAAASVSPRSIIHDRI
jgi:hypothetical protein